MDNTTQPNTLLQLMEILSENSEDSRLGDEFWADNQVYADELAGRLSITPTQAVLLSICLRRGPRNINFDDIASHLAISNIRALHYSDDINALVRAKILRYRDAKDEDLFEMPAQVVRALRSDEAPEPPVRTGLSCAELFDVIGELFKDLDDNAIIPRDLFHELKDLFAGNPDLSFVRELNALGINAVSHWLVLVILCHLLVNKDDDSICYNQIEDVYNHKSNFSKDKAAFRSGTHYLMEMGLVEHECENGQANVNRIHLTKKAKTLLLADFNLHVTDVPMGGIVNVPDIKSKWVGESEKNIKEVFDRYRQAVERSELAPILLFNEADAIIGIRREGATSAVDKMENSIQNIILQEMETLEGIMIATTNLTRNLDPAFERRFLYKICFEKPDASVREKIWHAMLPTLKPEECAALASAYDLSGGQMENVARKYSINSILYGSEKPTMDVLRAYCNAERLDSQTHRRIGF